MAVVIAAALVIAIVTVVATATAIAVVVVVVEGPYSLSKGQVVHPVRTLVVSSYSVVMIAKHACSDVVVVVVVAAVAVAVAVAVELG